MAEEDIDLIDSLTTAFYITISVATPLILLYIAGEQEIVLFKLELPFSAQYLVLGVFVLFNLTFSISILDEWRE